MTGQRQQANLYVEARGDLHRAQPHVQLVRAVALRRGNNLGWKVIGLLLLSVLLVSQVYAPTFAQDESGVVVTDPELSAAPSSTVNAAQTAALPNCDNSPFGQLLTIGAEREVFIGYRGASAPYQGWLAFTRLDLDAGDALQAQETWLGGATDATLTNVAATAGAAGDLNADGKVEFLQAFRDSAGLLGAASHSMSSGHDRWNSTSGTEFLVAAAAGNLTGVVGGDDELAIANVSGATNLNVRIVNGSGVTPGALDIDDRVLGRFWSRDNNRGAARLLDVATGDLNGDGKNDEIVVAISESTDSYIQLIIFRYTGGYAVSTGTTFASDLQDIASLRFEASRVLNLSVATGDLDGDYRDEIVLGFDHERPDNDGYSDVITVRTYAVDLNNAAAPIVQRNQWINSQGQTPNLKVAAGDTDADGLDEVVVAYERTSYGLTLHTLDAEASVVLEHNYIQSSDNFRTMARSLALDAADLDGDGRADIVAAFRDAGSWLQVIRATDVITAGFGLQVASAWRDGAEGRTNVTNISVALGDWDNDSLKAAYAPAAGGSLKCKEVVEPQLASAVFLPPYWQNIQGAQYMFGSIGRSRSQETTNESSLTTSHSHSASGYFGVGVGVEGQVYSFEASLKLTAGYEYAAEETRTDSTNTGQSLSVGWSNFQDFIVADTTRYHCFQYQLVKNGATLDGAARFCQNQGLENESMSLAAWDTKPGIELQWTPIVRDWANLALFRGESALQSSVVATATAALALDNNMEGAADAHSIALTQREQSPWWQVDLGSVQEIGKVRLWNRTNQGCVNPNCANELANFYVFISEEDPRTISNDPTVLKNAAGVHTLEWPRVAGRVVNLKATDSANAPMRGRYVRVQLAGMGELGLAEVQILGANHVEPDRYPVAVWDPDASTTQDGKYRPGVDGWFNVSVFDPISQQYTTIRQRGNLLWNGSLYNVLQNERIDRGDSVLSWALSQTNGASRTTATSVSHTARIGAEFDVEAGIIPTKIQTGGSYEYATGFGRAESRTLSWQQGFEIDGGVQGFPASHAGQPIYWPAQCRYGFQPYYYEVVEESSYGYQHRLLVIDYIVPAASLDRTRDLTPCLAGQSSGGSNDAPQANNDVFTVARNGANYLLDVLGNDQDPNGDALTLTAVTQPAHGQATLSGNKIAYTPMAGFAGDDTFSYTVSDGVNST
ncbi:MAG TPA: cadherin-like domain-containing protein, partial [Chloroflexi bacterium]|nr:cadherin-like domain-containing protein [Chloroflexota bacterium]